MGSSTARMGSERFREKAHSRFTHEIRKSVGLSELGSNLNDRFVNFLPHQGHSSNGIGDGLRSSFRKRIVLARAVSWSGSPLLPMRLGVAARPTQSPISNGQSPNLTASFWRSSS